MGISNLPCRLPPSHHFLCCNCTCREGAFLYSTFIFYTQQRTLFTKRVKRLLPNPFQSDTKPFLLVFKSSHHSLIFLFLFFFFLPYCWPLKVASKVAKLLKHPVESCFPAMVWPHLCPLCCCVWRHQMVLS